MDIEFGYRDKEEFEHFYIYEGMNAFEMSKMYAVDNTVIYDWVKRHNLPNHKNKQQIIDTYGDKVYDNIVKRKHARYSASNKMSHAHLVGKSLDQIYGKDEADRIKAQISVASSGREVSAETRAYLSKIRKGNSNPNWLGGFYSKEFKHIDRAVIRKVAYSYNSIACVDKDYICEDCGLKDYSNHGHHILSFSTIFGEICTKASELDELNTDFVLKHMYKFHKLYSDKIYMCLCSNCHKLRHSNTSQINSDISGLMYLLEEYLSKI